MKTFRLFAVCVLCLTATSRSSVADTKAAKQDRAVETCADKDKSKSLPLVGIIKVRSDLHVSVSLADASNPSDELKSMETARNALYDVANRECGTLQQTFAADCHLAGMAIESAISNRGARHTIELSVANTYELRQKP